MNSEKYLTKFWGSLETFIHYGWKISCVGTCKIVASLVAPTWPSLMRTLIVNILSIQTRIWMSFTTLESEWWALWYGPRFISIWWILFLSYFEATSKFWVFLEPHGSFLPTEEFLVLQNNEHNMKLLCPFQDTFSTSVFHTNLWYALYI